MQIWHLNKISKDNMDIIFCQINTQLRRWVKLADGQLYIVLDNLCKRPL